VRSNPWFWFALGGISLCVAAALGTLAIQQATEMSAYHRARACPASAPSNASCLHAVNGSVAGVTENPEQGADYALDVRTASGRLRLSFSSDGPMLQHAVDASPAVVTTWRGVAVKVETDGRSEFTTSVPVTQFGRELGYSLMSGGLSIVFAAVALWIRRRVSEDTAQPYTPAYVASSLSLLFGGIVVGWGGIALRAWPAAFQLDLIATGSALIVVMGLVAWLANGVRIKRRPLGPDADLARALERADDAHHLDHHLQPPFKPAGQRTILPRAGRSRSAIPAAERQTRLQASRLARVLSARGHDMVLALLLTAVCFGVFFTTKDGPPARAFRHAPACVGETNLASCIGDFTAVVHAVRSPANDANGATVSYVTKDGAIKGWAQFDGNSVAETRAALADERTGAARTITVWRRSIVGAQLGGNFHWTDGNPPGNTVPAAFLGISFALLLLMVRLGIHLRLDSSASTSRVLIDDVGQLAVAAGSIFLLAKGFWPGAVLAVAVLIWLGLSAWRSG